MNEETAGNGILIVGGYGHVGRLIAADMAPRFAERVVVAGRNGGRAQALADQVGNGARGMALDATDSAAVDRALEGVALVICCIDQEEPYLLRSAVERGLAYTDLSAELDLWMTARELEDEARRTGARVLVGAGLVPGLAGVMAREAVALAGADGSLDVSILLSIGDSFGAAALDWMLGAAGRTFTITEHGQARRVRGMTEKRHMAFPDPFGAHTVYRFAIPDQVFYPETLGVHRAGSWVSLEPEWIGTILAASVRSGLVWALHSSPLRRALTRAFEWLQRGYAGHDAYALTVRAEGAGGTARLSVADRNESHGTARSAAVMADALLAGGQIDPGVWLPEQVFEPAPFFAALDRRGISVQRDQKGGI